MKQKEIIIAYLRELNNWQFEYKIRALQTQFGWIGARGDRDVRELVKSSVLEKRLKGKYCQVRINPWSEFGKNTRKPVKVHIEIENYNVSYEIPITIPQAKLPF